MYCIMVQIDAQYKSGRLLHWTFSFYFAAIILTNSGEEQKK